MSAVQCSPPIEIEAVGAVAKHFRSERQAADVAAVMELRNQWVMGMTHTHTPKIVSSKENNKETYPNSKQT